MIRISSRFLYFFVPIITFGFNLSVGQTHLPQPNIEKSIEKLVEQGYLGQAQFFKDVELAWPDALPILIKNIEHPDENIREMIVKSLRFNRAPCSEVGESIGKRLGDQIQKVRYESVYSLSDLNCKSQVEEIKNLIKSEKDLEVLNIAIPSLGKLGTSTDISFLKDIEQDELRLLGTRLQATYALAKLNGPYDSQLIKTGLTTDNDEIKTTSLRALGKTGNLDLYKSLETDIQHLKTENKFLKEATYAEKAVVLYARNQSVTQQEYYLFSLLDDKEAMVRQWAALKVAEEFADPKNVEKLADIASTPSKRGSEEAFFILLYKKLKTQEELFNLMSKKQSSPK